MFSDEVEWHGSAAAALDLQDEAEDGPHDDSPVDAAAGGMLTDTLIRARSNEAVIEAEGRKKARQDDGELIKAEAKGKGKNRTWFAGSREGWVFKKGEKGFVCRLLLRQRCSFPWCSTWRSWSTHLR